MKILVIATWYPHEENPAEAPFNAEHVEAIRSQGHEVRVIHVRLGTGQGMPQSANGLWDGVPVRRVAADPKRLRTLLRTQRTIANELAWADVVHTMAFSSILVTLPVWISGKLRGKGLPWVHTEHWNGVVNPKSVSPTWEKLAWLRRVLVFPHTVTGVTAQLASEMQRFARPHAAIVVPCVVKGPATVVDASFGDPLQLVAVGGLVARKRPLATIATIAWLKEQGVHAELTWVGDGPQRGECESLIEQLGVSDRVTLLGAVRPEEVPACLSAADMFFLPTEQENFFTSAAEALAAGRAVIATKVGGFSDYADNSNSRLVDDVSPESLGRAVIEAAAAFRLIPAAQLAAPIRLRFSPTAVGTLMNEAYAQAVSRA